MKKEELLSYNQDLKNELLKGFVHLRGYIMDHTLAFIEADGALKNKVEESIRGQSIILSSDLLEVIEDGPTTDISIHDRRSFNALSLCKGKTAILNFANAFSPGGAPWSGSAQEESLCHCSTLYPCLKALEEDFYLKHRKEGKEGLLGPNGTDDMIYTPGVVQFKTDANVQLLLPESDWREADIITCAAPDLGGVRFDGIDYSLAMERRVDRILRLAKAKGVESLVLGAFGCGVFKNPPEFVATCFKESLKRYRFEKVVFAIIDETALGLVHDAFSHVFGLDVEA